MFILFSLHLQLISWLRTVSDLEVENSLLSVTVRSATAWCDGYTVPLLVPLTGWLPVPLPSQIRCMTVPGSGHIRCLEVSPSKQHLIISPKVGDPQLWHIMSNTLMHTFKGTFPHFHCPHQYYIVNLEFMIFLFFYILPYLYMHEGK